MLIKIDRSTIRPNPRAGRYDYQVPGRRATTIVRVEADLDDSDVYWRRTYVNGTLISEEPIPYGQQKLGVVSIETDMNLQTLYSLSPEPKWLYEYEDTIVMCKYCGETFPYTELKADIHIDDGYAYRDCICPHCNQFECCESLCFEILDVISLT